MAQTPVLVESRNISGKGVLQIPSGKYRVYTLFVDVLREPSSPYSSVQYNPPQSFYCTVNWMYGIYVCKTVKVQYDSQYFVEVPDVSGQVLIAAKCFESDMLQTFVNLGQALGFPAISVNNSISSYTFLSLPYDSIRIVCYADSAVKVALYRTDYDSCEDDFKTPQPPPPPPPPVTKTPQGSPLSGGNTVSPAYDGNNDGGNTVPNPLDTPVTPPPIGTPCANVTVNVTYDVYNALGQPTGNQATTGFIVFGVVSDVRIIYDYANSHGDVQIFCQGEPKPTGSGVCAPSPYWYSIAGGSNYGSLVSWTASP